MTSQQHRRTDINPEPWSVIECWELGYFDGSIVEAIAQWRNRPTRRECLASLFRARELLDQLILLETRKSLRALADRGEGNDDAAMIWLRSHEL